MTITKNNKVMGRPRTGTKRCSIAISGTKEQLEELKEKAKKEGKKTSAYVFEKCGIKY